MFIETILLVTDYIYYCILLAIPIDVSNATANGLIDWINTSYKLQVCLFIHCIQTYALLFSIFAYLATPLDLPFLVIFFFSHSKIFFKPFLTLVYYLKKCWNIVCFLQSIIECGFKQRLFCSLLIHSVLFRPCKCNVSIRKSVSCTYSFHNVLQIIALSVPSPESVSSFLYYHLILQ